MVQNAALWKRRQRCRLRELVRRTKDGKPCTDCKVEFPHYVLQFDHVRGEKLGDVADLVNRAVATHMLLAEIEKCELVCANCHATRTWQRRSEEEEEDQPEPTALSLF